MRQASITTSWLADRNAIAAATAKVGPGCKCGSLNASPITASASKGWITTSHPRRRPNPGTGAAWSNTGDHKNFSV